MAKLNLATDNSIQVRASSIEENRAILREIQAKKEVDARNKDELSTLFDDINAKCASKLLKEKKKTFTLASSYYKIVEQQQDSIALKPVHYGPLPGYSSGKWWGIRMDCSRDCVHEPFNENIHDGPYGAVSICTSHLNTYNDVDLGNVLTFTSREYTSLTSKSNDSLVLSYKNRVPIRLVRSYCLSNKYAPKTGYRYDGLYTVVRHWIGVSTAADTTKYHKFVLTRVVNQEPPPWSVAAAAGDKKVNFKTPRLKRSSSRLVLARSSHTSDQESKTIKFLYNKVEKKSKPSSVSAIVSRQVFDKCTFNSPAAVDGRLQLTVKATAAATAADSTNQLCSTNLSIRTNLYDSSHQAAAAAVIQDVKTTSISACKLFKPNQKFDQTIKKVTWAAAAAAVHACNTELHVDEKGCVMKYNNGTDYCPYKNRNTKNTKSSDEKSKINLSSSSTTDTVMMKTVESSSTIDSLAPDKLVSVIVKEKYHPMAKLLIGNMIGLENQEAAIVNAYNALTKVNQDDSKQQQYKLRNKFSIKSPKKSSSSILNKKQRREIANLTIDAKFDTRSSRSRGRLGTNSSNSSSSCNQKKILKSESTRRKLLNTRSRLQGEKKKKKKVQNTVAKVKKMVTVWTQCSLLVTAAAAAVPASAPTTTVDRGQQTDDSNCYTETSTTEPAASQPIKVESLKASFSSTYYTGSAFAAVSADSNDGLARLRSIGFRPILAASLGDAPIENVESGDESSRPASADQQQQQLVNQEYNKYTSEENDVVGYMAEQLHFEDIEEEMCIEENNSSSLQSAAHSTNILPQPIETLTEHDFNKPWHGWRKISINGQTYWTGC